MGNPPVAGRTATLYSALEELNYLRVYVVKILDFFIEHWPSAKTKQRYRTGWASCVRESVITLFVIP